MWSYLAAAAREQRARQERDELAAELAEKQGKGRAAEFLERIGFVGRLATYLVFFGLFAIWYPDFGVYQKPLAEVSAAALVFPMWWLGMLLLVVVLLFQPRKHPHIRQFWGVGLSA